MSKAEEREAIKQAMKNFKKPIRIVTEEEENDRMTDQSMHDGETRSISNYHYQDGSVGHRQF